MFKFFNNLKLLTKVIITPVIISVFLAAIILIALVFLNDQKNVVGSFYSIRYSHLHDVEEINHQLLTQNMNIYKLISWVSLKYPSDRIDELIKEQKDMLTEQVSALGLLLNDKNLIPEETGLIKKAAVNMNLYAENVRIVIDIIRTDTKGASSTLNNAENNFNNLRDNLQALESVEDFAGKNSFDKINLNFGLAIIVFIIVFIVSGLAVFSLISSVSSWFSHVIIQFNSVTKAIEKGDLGVTLKIDFKDELGNLARSFNKILVRLNESYAVIREMSENIDGNSEVLLSKSGLLSISSEKQAESSMSVFDTTSEYLHSIENSSGRIEKQMGIISTAASSINTLNDGIQNIVVCISDLKKEISENARMTAESRDKFVLFEKNILSIGKFLEDFSISIHKFEEYSENIDQILTVIRDISEQTSMLAMNAAIEAAHAGSAGEGFAIVASEVRKLSESSAKSATEIGTIINSIKNGIREAADKLATGSASTKLIAESASESGKSLEQILETVSKIDRMAMEIASTTQEQGRSAMDILKHSESLKTFSVDINRALLEQRGGAGKIISAIETVSSSTEENVKSAEDLAALAKSLKEDSRKLAQTVRSSD